MACARGWVRRPPILRSWRAPATTQPGATEWAVPGQVGVGPWPGDPADWPADERYDPELLAHGDTRNVVDAYRYWRRDAVAADLAARAHPFHVAIENFGHDHNIGTVVRTANAFGAAGVHIVGRRRWNRRGAMVTDRYLAVHHHDDVARRWPTSPATTAWPWWPSTTPPAPNAWRPRRCPARASCSSARRAPG